MRVMPYCSSARSSGREQFRHRRGWGLLTVPAHSRAFMFGYPVPSLQFCAFLGMPLSLELMKWLPVFLVPCIRPVLWFLSFLLPVLPSTVSLLPKTLLMAVACVWFPTLRHMLAKPSSCPTAPAWNKLSMPPVGGRGPSGSQARAGEVQEKVCLQECIWNSAQPPASATPDSYDGLLLAVRSTLLPWLDFWSRDLRNVSFPAHLERFLRSSPAITGHPLGFCVFTDGSSSAKAAGWA